MLPIERVKEILNDPTLTDAQVEEIRDGFHSLVEDVIFPKWLEDRKKGKNKKVADHPYEKENETAKS